jgi:hypothetical protein
MHLVSCDYQGICALAKRVLCNAPALRALQVARAQVELPRARVPVTLPLMRVVLQVSRIQGSQQPRPSTHLKSKLGFFALVAVLRGVLQQTAAYFHFVCGLIFFSLFLVTVPDSQQDSFTSFAFSSRFLDL